MLWISCCRCRQPKSMTETEGPKRPKLSFFETFRAVGGPYGRLYQYVKPYKWRFVLGLALGLAFGALTSLLPVVIAQVSSVIFNGAVPNFRTVVKHREMLSAGPDIATIASVCLVIPVFMIARGLLSYGNTYFMNWVSNRVVL